MRRAFVPAIIGSVFAGTHAAAQPQRAASTPAHPVVAAVVAMSAGSHDDLRRTLARAAAFRLTAEPGRIMVMRVPLPADVRSNPLHRRSAVSYRIIPGTARVLGRIEGVVANVDATVGVTLSVSRAAAAGRNEGALVEFTSATGIAVAVPIELDVPSVHNVQLVVPDAFIGGARGNWSSVRFEISNRGNDAETLMLRTVTPQGWRGTIDELPANVSLTAGRSARGTLRIWIPNGTNLGQAVVRLFVQAQGATVATSEVRVDVRDAPDGREPGPRLMLSAVGASAPDGSTSLGYGASVYGSLADSVTVSARFSLTGAGDGNALYGVARSGIASAPPSLSIESPRAGISAGAVGTPLSELAGFFVSGLGASARAGTRATAVQAFAVRPFGLSQNAMFATSGGGLAGLSVERTIGRFAASVAGVHLRDESGAHALDAISVRSRIGAMAGGELSTEGASREFSDGVGLGFAGTYRRATSTSSIEVRALHAPGGSQAYARAANDLSVSLSKRIGRMLNIAGSAWRQDDDNQLVGKLASSGWYVAPSLSFRTIGTTIGLEGRGNRFSSTTDAGAFRNSESQAGVNLESRRGIAYLSARSSYGVVGRAIEFEQLSMSNAAGRRLESRAAIGATIHGGTVEGTWTSQQFSGPAGLLPEQQVLGMRADRIRVPSPAVLPVTFNADVQRLSSGGTTAGLWTARGGFTVVVPGGLGLTLQAERNPFLFTSRSSRGLLYTMRLDRTTDLPRLVQRTRSVFADANGNGLRDAGERGISGVMLECGSTRVVTDAKGSFACSSGYQVAVDARSVPTGLLAPGIRGATASADIPLRLAISRSVQLTLVESDSFRVTQADLARAIVLARDPAGAAWMARSTGLGAFVFDALPPGRYQLEFDGGDISEPLRAAAVLPEIWARDGDDAHVLSIELKPRGVRMKQLGSKATDGSALRNGITQDVGARDESSRSPSRTPMSPKTEKQQ